jgi:hypothetical protein
VFRTWRSSEFPLQVSVAAEYRGAGGRYLTSTGNITRLDGRAPERFALTKFEDVAKAEARYADSIRAKSTDPPAFVVRWGGLQNFQSKLQMYEADNEASIPFARYSLRYGHSRNGGPAKRPNTPCVRPPPPRNIKIRGLLPLQTPHV